jgi:hypothetical protein
VDIDLAAIDLNDHAAVVMAANYPSVRLRGTRKPPPADARIRQLVTHRR